MPEKLLEIKSQTSMPLFFKTDTHWNHAGALIALDDVLQRVKGREMPWPEDRTARHQEFNALLARRDQEEMLLMLRCIYARRRSLKKAGKHLPGMDDDIMHSCEKLLTQEFSLCLQIPPEEVGEYLHNALDGDPC